MKHLPVSISCILLLTLLDITAAKSVDTDETVNGLAAFRSAKRVKRVIGGDKIEQGDWPHLVKLRGEVPYRFFWGIPLAWKHFHCSASLISGRHILTAAHCILQDNVPTDRRVQGRYWHSEVGAAHAHESIWDWFRKFFGSKTEYHAVRVYTHPNYDDTKLWYNDVAVLELEDTVDLSDDDIGVIQLAEMGSGEQVPAAGTTCIMKGWGCDEAGGSVLHDARAVNLTIKNQDMCGSFYSVPYSTSREARVCAGTFDSMVQQGICSGDSGGPLICKDGNTWKQYGIASFTTVQNPGTNPAGFTRVSYYRAWIDNIIGG